jgi:hypothetical protein
MNAQVIRCPVGHETCPRPEVLFASIEKGNGIPTCGSEGACGRRYCLLRLSFPVLPQQGTPVEQVLRRCGL